MPITKQFRETEQLAKKTLVLANALRMAVQAWRAVRHAYSGARATRQQHELFSHSPERDTAFPFAHLRCRHAPRFGPRSRALSRTKGQR